MSTILGHTVTLERISRVPTIYYLVSTVLNMVLLGALEDFVVEIS